MKKIEETSEEKQAREMIEGIASNLEKLSKSVSALLSGGLKKKSIVILLAWSSSLPQYQVEKLLDAIVNIKKDHLQ